MGYIIILAIAVGAAIYFRAEIKTFWLNLKDGFRKD